jgi:hypothetical protein
MDLDGVYLSLLD